MEQINQWVFAWINATPESSQGMISFASFVARDLIMIIPLLIIVLWLWGKPNQVSAQRQLIAKSVISLGFGLLVSFMIGMLLPHERPFVDGFGYTFLSHAPSSSFPSNHGTAIFSFALAFLCWHRLWSGLTLMVIGLAIAWSRVYLGVHWPVDMLGAVLVSMLACLFAQLVWNLAGDRIATTLGRLYRICFALPIKKGWVQE